MIASLNLQACRERYHELCNPRPWLIDQLNELAQKEESCRKALSNNSLSPDFIMTKQQELNTIRADIRRYRRVLHDYEEPTPVAIDREFEHLITLPGAYRINDCPRWLILSVHCQTPYNGRIYDRGDWDLYLGRLTPTDAVVRELRTGIKPSWGHVYPDYRLPDSGYCFGPRRRQQIFKLLGSGQLLAGASLIIDCLQGVNPEDKYRIPQAFFEVKPR